MKFLTIQPYKRLAALLLTTTFILTGCGQPTNVATNKASQSKGANQILVVSTIFPEYDFAKAIGGETVDAKILIPPGTEAHHYEPTPQDLMLLKDADVFVYTSEAMEPWVTKLLSQVGPNTKIVEASKGVQMLSSDALGVTGALVEHEEGATGETHDAHGNVDPHIWLDPENSKIMAQNIEVAMAEANPEAKGSYETHLKAYEAALDDLNEAYSSTLSQFENKSIMFAGHFAFGYLAHKWQIDIYSPYEGFSPDAEPSPQKIAEMIDLMGSKKIKTVYYEELVDPKIARVISSEAGADMVMLHAAHNVSKEELEKGITYLDIMKENLNKLKAGFEK